MTPFSLTVESERGPLKVSWENFDDLNAYLSYQVRPVPRTEKEVEWTWKRRWHQLEGIGLFRNLSQHVVVIDIGAGMSIIDLLLAQYLPGATFYLVDHDDRSQVVRSHWNDAAADKYNSFDPVRDAIKATDLDPARFHFVPPDRQDWPKASLITSYWSWCHHYPARVYLERVMASINRASNINNGTTLFTHIRQKEQNNVDLITDRLAEVTGFRRLPIKMAYTLDMKSVFDETESSHPDIWTWGCAWI